MGFLDVARVEIVTFAKPVRVEWLRVATAGRIVSQGLSSNISITA
jgi:hypothetical protein